MRRREEATPHKRDRGATRTRPAEHPVLALQRAAGNAAVTRLLARQIIGYTDGATGQFQDSVKGEVEVLRSVAGREGGRPWPVLKAKDGWFLYIWPGDLKDEEEYIKLAVNGKNAEGVATGRRKEAARTQPKHTFVPQKQEGKAEPHVPGPEELARIKRMEVADALMRDLLVSGKWKPEVDRETREERDHHNLIALIREMKAGLEWLPVSLDFPPPFDELGPRLAWSFGAVARGLVERKMEPTPELISQVRKVVQPLLPEYRSKIEPGKISTEAQVKISQALSEIEWAAVVLQTRTLAAPYVLGAQGRRHAPGQVEGREDESQHGDLPPLQIVNLELDGYYRTDDGVLHGDEVKDTPRALADKLEDGGQIERHMRWLQLEAVDDLGKPIRRRVTYFARAEGPRFHRLFGPVSLRRFEALDKLQPGGVFLQVGGQAFTYEQYRQLDQRMEKWLIANGNAFRSDPELADASERFGFKAERAYNKYLDSLSMTLGNLERTLPVTSGKPEKSAKESEEKLPVGTNKDS